MIISPSFSNIKGQTDEDKNKFRPVRRLATLCISRDYFQRGDRRTIAIMGTPSLIFLAGFLAVQGRGTETGVPPTAEFTCGLLEFLPNDQSQPYVLPTLSDNLPGGERAWTTPTFGDIVGAGYYTHPHSPYLNGVYGPNFYGLNTNDLTRNFVREQETREMIRRIQIKCSDGNNPDYSFRIPFQDMTPPEFEEREYTFNIPLGWNLEHSLSNQQLVDVSDNAPEELNFVPYPDIVRVEAHRIAEMEPVMPKINRYFYRLDIYLKTAPTPGNTQIVLSAQDKFNSGVTTISINASDGMSLIK